jgi:hypothetical protein
MEGDCCEARLNQDLGYFLTALAGPDEDHGGFDIAAAAGAAAAAVAAAVAAAGVKEELLEEGDEVAHLDLGGHKEVLLLERGRQCSFSRQIE